MSTDPSLFNTYLAQDNSEIYIKCTEIIVSLAHEILTSLSRNENSNSEIKKQLKAIANISIVLSTSLIPLYLSKNDLKQAAALSHLSIRALEISVQMISEPTIIECSSVLLLQYLETYRRLFEGAIAGKETGEIMLDHKVNSHIYRIEKILHENQNKDFFPIES